MHSGVCAAPCLLFTKDPGHWQCMPIEAHARPALTHGCCGCGASNAHGQPHLHVLGRHQRVLRGRPPERAVCCACQLLQASNCRGTRAGPSGLTPAVSHGLPLQQTAARCSGMQRLRLWAGTAGCRPVHIGKGGRVWHLAPRESRAAAAAAPAWAPQPRPATPPAHHPPPQPCTPALDA
jgi:hypothetical protein